jgi:hypothetical protein
MNLLKRTVKVRVETASETTQKTYPFAQISYTVGGVYHEATEIPSLVERAPAFEPPKYERLKYEDQLYAVDGEVSASSGTAKPPRHERVREHNVATGGNSGSAQRSTQRPRNTAPKAANSDRDGEPQIDANFRKSNRRANDTAGHGGQSGSRGHRPNNRGKK